MLVSRLLFAFVSVVVRRTKKNVGIEAPKTKFRNSSKRVPSLFHGFARETPNHCRPSLRGAEEAGFHKTVERRRSLEEFAFGFEGVMRPHRALLFKQLSRKKSAFAVVSSDQKKSIKRVIFFFFWGGAAGALESL